MMGWVGAHLHEIDFLISATTFVNGADASKSRAEVTIATELVIRVTRLGEF
jgi:hypothetical protein